MPSIFDAFEHGRARVGEIDLHFRRAGSGPPVVLLHGWPQHSLMWHAIAPVLAERFTVSPEHFESYVHEVSKPGALRAGLEYYAAVWQDARDNAEIKQTPLAMPALALGGEASSGPELDVIWSAVLADMRTTIIPKAGHWLGDENPAAVADTLTGFFGEP